LPASGRHVACRNATEATRRAGYSPPGAAASGCKQLRKPAVLAALRAGLSSPRKRRAEV
jgi:phage terminase small subunit